MSRVVALLRAVNLGPHQKVSSAQLKELAAGLGFEDPATLLNSGNLVFEAGARKPDGLEKKLEAESARRLGLATSYFVRTGQDLEGLVARNPFPDVAADDPSHLVVLFLKKPPTAAGLNSLRAAIVGRERIEVDGRHVVAHYVDGIGESKLTNKLLEKHLGAEATGRNWNTVLKLRALLQQR
jgi:uncharacterized protein (DUF1697 family)